MNHKHHIIPKHMGGTDEPSNLIELTIEEHAIEHKKLWEKHGKREDYRQKAIQRHKDGVYDYEKLRLSRIGFKQPESQKQKVSEKLSKKWSITSPKGETLVVENLNNFCKEHGLDQGNLSRGSYKGWKCLKIGP